mgnify:CR=1 FL=1
MKLTAIIWSGEDGWLVGQIAEYPAALAQAKTVDELKVNLAEAFYLLLDSYKATTLAEAQREDPSFTTTDLTLANETERFAPASS